MLVTRYSYYELKIQPDPEAHTDNLQQPQHTQHTQHMQHGCARRVNRKYGVTDSISSGPSEILMQSWPSHSSTHAGGTILNNLSKPKRPPIKGTFLHEK